MASLITIPAETEKAILEIARKKSRFNDVIPVKFIKYLESFNQWRYVRDKSDCINKNPLIVALGDSVTQGCFEGNLNYTVDMIKEFYPDGIKLESVIDTENVYHEKFRIKLSHKYNAPVSVINSGIGGDSVVNMLPRIHRDVLLHSPHLVLINASLNGPSGDIGLYEKYLRAIIERIIDNCEAEIILITPNMIAGSWKRDLDIRVNIIRDIAVEKHLCIADTYAVWEEIEASGINMGVLLSNRINHPVIAGHEIYAIELMKLFEK